MSLKYAPVVCLTVLCVYFFYSLNSGLTITNDGSHFALFDALVTRGDPELKHVGQFAIGDSALYQGRYYSDRNPGLAFFAYTFYSCTKFLEPWMEPLFLDPVFGDRYDEGQRTRIPIVMLVPAISGGLLLLGCFNLCRQFAIKNGPALVSAFVIIFGTILLRYTTVLYSHAFASALLVLGLSFIFSWRQRPRAWKLALGSFLLSFAVLTEHLLVIGFLPIAIYLLVSAPGRTSPCKTLFTTGLGAIVPAGLLLTYNWICFDSPFSIAHFHHSTDTANHDMETLLRLDQTLNAATNLLFGAAKSEVGRQDLTGLFSHSPFLYFLLLSPVLIIRGRTKFKGEFLVIAVAVVLIVLGGSSVFAPYGGWDRDYRYFAAAVPLLTPFIALVLQWILRPHSSTAERIFAWFALLLWASLSVLSIQNQLVHIRHDAQSAYPEITINASAAVVNVSLGLSVLAIVTMVVWVSFRVINRWRWSSYPGNPTHSTHETSSF